MQYLKIPKVFLLLFLLVLLLPYTSAQEQKEVCLVYFVSHTCGDACGLTDEFMSGLINEYFGRLVAIKYYIDANPESIKMFEAYRKTYNLPYDVPLVLFGKDDYLQGVEEIYNQTEKRVFDLLEMNGTNCPLESGYVPAKELKPEVLPGSPEILIGNMSLNEEENKTGILEINESEMNKTEETSFDLILLEEEKKETIFSLILILSSLCVVAIAIFFLWKSRK
jgi:hypothetical protein